MHKLITSITLGEYFHLGFFDKRVTTPTHMVSCNETSKENGSTKDEEKTLIVEPSKTKEENKVVASLQCLPRILVAMKYYKFLIRCKVH